MHFLHSSYHDQTLYQIFAIYLRVGMFVVGLGFSCGWASAATRR